MILLVLRNASRSVIPLYAALSLCVEHCAILCNTVQPDQWATFCFYIQGDQQNIQDVQEKTWPAVTIHDDL